ncbi:MAG: FG-GAP repeat domain-containing protein [bacterium]
MRIFIKSVFLFLLFSVYILSHVSKSVVEAEEIFFVRGNNYHVGHMPQSLAVADFNGDETADLAVANFWDNNCTIFLGNGDGTFEERSICNTGKWPRSVAAGDYNRDGIVDLATANKGDAYVSIMLGQGDGTFRAAEICHVGIEPHAIAVSDFDKDGKLDLAVTNMQSDTISILLGKGNGTFNQSVEYEANCDGPGAIVAAYFNRDKIVDLAVTNEKSDSISILLGKGDGTFSTSHFSAVNGPCSLAAKDFNQDRKADLAVVNNVSNDLSIFLCENDGTFTPGHTYVLEGEPRSVTCGDFNNDGKPDLAVINYISYYISRVALFLGNGDDEGSFVEAGTYTAGMYSLSIQSEDLNGDSKEDLVFVNLDEDTISILINTTPTVASSNFSFEPTLSYPVGDDPHALTVVDFDGDTVYDLVVANQGSDTISVMLGYPNGTFTGASNYPVREAPSSVVTGDFNGDGIEDIAVANEASDDMSILLGQGTGLFDEPVHYTAVGMEGPCALISEYLDDDKKADLAVVNRASSMVLIFLTGGSDASGLFSEPRPILLPDPTAMWAADFNYDGNMDLAVTSGSEDIVYIKYGDPECTFKIPFKYYGVGRAPSSLTVADFNGDGTSDIAVANELSKDISILLGYSNGTFQIADNYEVGESITSVVAEDINGDGRVDLAVTHGAISLLAGRGDGTFGTLFSYEVGSGAYSLCTADLNADERADLVVANKDSGSVSILINNTPAIIVTPTSGLVTDEAGDFAEFRIELTVKPIVDVTINFIYDETEGEVFPPSLTFTERNWRIPQSVTVVGVDDDSVDGDVTYTIHTLPAVVVGLTEDINYYNRRESDDITVTNIDNDTAGITIEPSAIITTEEGGVAEFTIVLDTQPEADVSVDIVNSNEAEGMLFTQSFLFTEDNWNIPQSGVVMGLNDKIDDGDCVYILFVEPALSDDTHYNGIDPDDITVTNINNDKAGITVYPGNGLITSEDSTTDTFTIVLASEPTKDVMLSISSSDETEGVASVEDLTFSPNNWNIPQIVTIIGVDDNLVDRDVPYMILIKPSLSNDQTYNALDPNDVYVTNSDNDRAGTQVNPTEGLETSESGDTDSFTIALTSKPSAGVRIGLKSDNEEEGTVSVHEVVFTAANWNVPQTITITGVDDSVMDGNKEYTIIVAAIVSNDTDYNGLKPEDVSVTNFDDEIADILITPTKGLTTAPNGGIATFSVVLTIKPKADVSFSLSSSDEERGTVSPTSLTFTPDEWDIPQLVTVTGNTFDPSLEDNSFTIITGRAISYDDDYYGLNPVDIIINDPDAILDPNSQGGHTEEPATEAEEEEEEVPGCLIDTVK